MQTKRIAVIGAGAMGSGIAYICAMKGYEVAIAEVNEDLLRRGVAKIRQMIVDGVSRGKLMPKRLKQC